MDSQSIDHRPDPEYNGRANEKQLKAVISDKPEPCRRKDTECQPREGTVNRASETCDRAKLVNIWPIHAKMIP